MGDLTFACVNVRSPTTGNSGCSVQFMMTSMVTSSFSTCKVVGLDPPCKPGPSELEGVLDNFQHALEVQRLPLVLALASICGLWSQWWAISLLHV